MDASGLNGRDVREALHSVIDPCSIATGVPIDIVDMGLVERLEVDEAAVHVSLRLTSPFCLQAGLLRDRIAEVVAPLLGERDLDIAVDHAAEWEPGMIASGAQARLRALRPRAAQRLGDGDRTHSKTQDSEEARLA